VCDTIVVVRSSGVLFAKNSDRDPNEAQVLEWHPRHSHPADTTVRCTHIEIPQVAETNAVLLSRPFWMWGAEIGANEHNVVIGNEAVFTDQPYKKTGLTGMDLIRLALERSNSAHSAVETITALLEQHGQGGGCGYEHPDFTYHNSFIVADPTEAYVLETAGSLWEVEHITEGARSISNGLTIPGFAKHSDFVKTTVSACRTRQPLTQRLAGEARGAGDMMAVLRDHNGPEPSYGLLAGAMGAPCVHAGGLAAGSESVASWVADLSPSRSIHWATGTSAPCTGLFKPVTVNHPVDVGPAPAGTFDPSTLWWSHERFHRRVLKDPDLYDSFVSERDETERRWLADPPSSEEAFATASSMLTSWLEQVTEPTDRRPAFVRQYWRTRNRQAGF
jgi:dipeptidase